MPKYSYVWKDQVPICVELLRKSLKSYQVINSYVTTAIQCHAVNQSKILLTWEVSKARHSLFRLLLLQGEQKPRFHIYFSLAKTAQGQLSLKESPTLKVHAPPYPFPLVFSQYSTSDAIVNRRWNGSSPSVLGSKDTNSFTGTITWRNVSLTREIPKNKIAEEGDMGGERAQWARCLWARMST